MTTLQQRAVQVTGRLSAVVRSTSTRIRAAQQSILKEEERREKEEKRLISGRVSRARRGLRRFLAFASNRSIQRLVKTNERLNGKGRTLSFHGLRWKIIGTAPTSYVSFAVGLQGIIITITNTCWRRKDVSAAFPFKGSEVVVRSQFAGGDELSWKSPARDILNRMATGLMSSLNEVSEESEKALRVLGLWSRPAPFETAAAAFLEQLERQVANELERRK